MQDPKYPNEATFLALLAWTSVACVALLSWFMFSLD